MQPTTRSGTPGERPRSSPSPRAPARPARCTSATCARCSPCTSWPTRSPAPGVPVRHLHVWDDYDRFRKVPVGRRPVVGRAHRPAALGRAGPPRSARLLGRALQGAAARRAARDGRRAGGGLARPSATDRLLPRARCSRRCAARDDIEAVLARYRTKAVERWRRRERSRSRRDAGRHRRRPGSRYKPYCRQCGRDTITADVVRRRLDRPRLHLLLCGYEGVTNLATQNRGQAGVEGRLADALGARAGRLRAGRRRPRDARVVVHRRQGPGRPRSSGWPMPTYFGYSFVGIAGMSRRCRRRAAACPTASDALRVLEAPILRWLYVRRQPRQVFTIDLGARGGPAVRRVGRARPQGRRPRRARRPGAGLRAGRPRPSPPGALPTSPVACRSGCSPRSPT